MKQLTFGAIGSVIGFVLAFLWELSTPSGFECFDFQSIVHNPNLGLQSFFQCWVVVIITMSFCGVIGTLIGSMSKSLGDI
jgi:hypothetical protein